MTEQKTKPITDQALISALENLTGEISQNNSRLAELYAVVMVGDPKGNKPSMIETVRNHDNFIGGMKRAGWILLGVIITAIPAFVFYTSMHVSAAAK
jgi:hypothetical protein